jgi:predicted porin
MKKYPIAYIKKKILIIFGVLLPGSAAWAQGSVTLYGTVDAGLVFTNKSFNETTGQSAGKQVELVNSGSQPSVFGLQGQEDLGGGLKANFKLESGISLANGGFDNTDGNFFGRQAWVGLSSNNLGEVRVGLQLSPFELALYDSDPRSFDQFASAINIYSNNTFSGAFVSNAVSYTSPKIAGLTASVIYSLGGVPGNFAAGRQYSASLRYDYGGLMVNAAIDDVSQSSDAVVNNTFFDTPFEGRTVGVGYRFANVNVKASFTNYKAPRQDIDGTTSGGDNNVWNIGFDYHVSPTIDINPGIWIIRDPHDSGNHALMAALGATYSLSRTTSLYAEVGIANNHGKEVIGLERDGAQEGVEGNTLGATIGITHRF